MAAADDPTVETPTPRPRFFTPGPFRLAPIAKAPEAQNETREDRATPPARPGPARESRLGALWPILAGTLALLVGGLLLRGLLSDGPDRRSDAASAFGAQGTGTAVRVGDLPAASGAPSSVVAGTAARTPEAGTEPSPTPLPPTPEALAESTLAPADFPPPTADDAIAPGAEPTASAPDASPTDVPTRTTAPPPGVAPGGSGGIALRSIPLEDGRFKGGYVPKGRRYKGRTVQVLFGQRSRYNTIRATFQIEGSPSGDRNENASVNLVGLDSADGFKTLLRIAVNGETVIQRPSPLREDSRDGKPAQWDAKLLAIDASLLHRGRNVLEISNLEEAGDELGPPWLMLDYAEVRFYEK